MATSNSAEGCPAYSEVDHGTSQRLVAEEDNQLQHTQHASSPPESNSSDEEIPRGRKRKRFSLSMAKRTADAAQLRDISLPPSSDTREASRKRSQSPAKTRNQLEHCTPPVIHKSAHHQPQHPVTRSRIKKFVQELSDETNIFTAAEKVSAVVFRSSQFREWSLIFTTRHILRIRRRTGLKPSKFQMGCFSIATTRGIHHWIGNACMRFTPSLRGQ